MKCLECEREVPALDNDHLVDCCGLTLQEYAIRHHLPLDLLIAPDRLNKRPAAADFGLVTRTPGEPARAVFEGLRIAGLVAHPAESADELLSITGEVRQIDLLLWDLKQLSDFCFQYHQDYEFDSFSNRVVARNRLTTLRRNVLGRPHDALSPVPPPDFATALAVCIGHVGELQAGYLFVSLARRLDAEEIRVWLERQHGVAMVSVGPADSAPVLLRSRTLADTGRLFAALQPQLCAMPGVWDRFHARTPEITVSKEVVFDSAHFITDHPAKCSNLHGGRYVLRVKVRGRVDPASGCVVDYGYLKKVVTREIIDLFDHHHLNYVAPELAWRSTTELLCVFIWERLIDHLPALVELELHETPQSSCRYTGPGLAEHQANGKSPLLTWFQNDSLGRSPLRSQLARGAVPTLRVVG
jgi:6-pyruvoyl tetrahydropterin synthase/QueD family protein